jgi:hypothetical protein
LVSLGRLLQSLTLLRRYFIRISKVINPDYINRLSAVASNNSSMAAGPQASDTVSLSQTLRFGARNFAGVVQQLNSVISTVNLVEATLTGLKEIVSSAKYLAESSSSESSSYAKRNSANQSFNRLREDFIKLSSQAIKNKIGEDDIPLFSEEGLIELFQAVGLDPEESKSIGKLFDNLSLDDEGELWAELTSPDGAFNGLVDLTDKSEAKTAFKQLNELEEIFYNNLKFVGEAKKVLGSNLELSRATGFAFLGVSEELTQYSEVEDVADNLVNLIRKAGSEALKQVENLELLTVAGLVKE